MSSLLTPSTISFHSQEARYPKGMVGRRLGGQDLNFPLLQLFFLRELLWWWWWCGRLGRFWFLFRLLLLFQTSACSATQVWPTLCRRSHRGRLWLFSHHGQAIKSITVFRTAVRPYGRRDEEPALPSRDHPLLSRGSFKYTRAENQHYLSWGHNATNQAPYVYQSGRHSRKLSQSNE